jgi:hypothetical protein
MINLNNLLPWPNTINYYNSIKKLKLSTLVYYKNAKIIENKINRHKQLPNSKYLEVLMAEFLNQTQ